MDRIVIDLNLIDEIEGSGTSKISLVDVPAIEKDWRYFAKQNFVDPSAGESQSDFMKRCVPVQIDEGKETDQAVAICISTYESKMGKDQFFYDAFADYPWDECIDDQLAKDLSEESAKNICGWIKANMAEDTFTDYPEAAKENARRALQWAEENGWGDCGTPIGKARANQLAKGEAISIDTVARMAAFIRHQQNSTTPYGEGCGKLMWDAWGGEEGIAWASRKLEQYNKNVEMEINTGNLAPYTEQVNSPRKKKSVLGAEFSEDGLPYDAFGYKADYFYMCPGAIATFDHLKQMDLPDDVIGMARAAALAADKVFEIEEDVIEDQTATPEQLNQAKLLVDDFKDIFAEIDKLTEMTHDVSYMDGHIAVIEEYIGNTPIDTTAIIEYAKTAGFSADDFTTNGMEFNAIPEGFNLELAKGYTVYKYQGPIGSNSRDFCREMINLDRFYTFEEIDAMGAMAVNPGFGLAGANTYSIWKYLGGPNCKHRWQKFYVTAEGTFQNKGPAPGLPGDPMIDRENNGYAFADERPLARIPKSERGRTGSDRNEPGDTKTSRGGIEVTAEVEKTLRDKIAEHNKKYSQSSKQADLGMLKAVWRRGAGAYSVGTPGRRGMTRNQWAMGRVNAFLKILAGSAPSDKDYNQDNDLLPKGHRKHSEEKMSKMMFVDESKRELVGAVAIPDMEIPRKAKDNSVFYVKFSKDVVKRMAEKFMREKRMDESNIQHNSNMDAGAYVFESWIVENKEDKANTIYDLNVPEGTWMVKMRVKDSNTWAKVKSGELRGFSLEGDFVTDEEYQAYLSDKKMYENLVSLVNSF